MRLIHHATLLLIATPIASAAQGGARTGNGYDFELLELDASARQSLLLGGGRMMPRHSYRASVTGHYENQPLLLMRNGVREGALIRDRFTLHAAGAFAATDKLEVSLNIPLLGVQAGDFGPDSPIVPPAGVGIGSPTVSARHAILSTRAGLLKEAPVDVAGELGLSLPFGSREAFLSDPGLALAPRVVASAELSSAILSVDLGALLRTVPVSPFPGQSVGSQLRFGVAAATLGPRLRLEAGLKAVLPLDGNPAALELLLGGRYASTSPMEVFLLGGPGLGTHPGSPAFRLLAGIAFAPRK
ncbi:MAG: hypothetical protein HYZ28_14910 [Myxococcales bacterium]|nr:hypothetical protein [Myxococcales bacterium]